MDATSFASWAIGTTISAAGLYFAWRIDGRQRTNERPIVEVTLADSMELPGWAKIAIVVRNPTPVTWDINEVSVRPQSTVRVVSDTNASARNGMGGMEISLNAAQASAASRPARLVHRVDPAGTASSTWGYGDTTHCAVFVSFVRPVKRLSIRITLRSREANARSVTIASRRVTSALTTKATSNP